jgi:hypothetical protein
MFLLTICFYSSFGGARRSRTADLLNAIQALSQLSYGPSREQESVVRNQKEFARHAI